MLPIDDILQTALREHDNDRDLPADPSAWVARVKTELAKEPAPFSPSSPALSLVTFKCMLQDTGYPMEVYGTVNGEGGHNLQERWVGWAVEIPDDRASTSSSTHPPALRRKFPLPEKQDHYLGALVKVYDGSVSFKPASTQTFIGIVSTAPLPTPLSEDEAPIVAAIHVLRLVESQSASTAADGIRDRLVQRLASAFDPLDPVAAELLLLLLISSPTARPTALPPLGTLTLNFLGPPPTNLNLVSPQINISLTLDLLHKVPFCPSSSDSASLDSGLLQLAEGTLLVIDETGMGEGGLLHEKAVKNLQALSECLRDQTVRYEYPYMDGLKIGCAIRGLILSEGKSLLPADIRLPVKWSTETPAIDDAECRAYLAQHSSKEHAESFSIPDEAASLIQEDFVASRRSGPEEAEAQLKRRMRLARVLAISHVDAELSGDVWRRAVELDEASVERWGKWGMLNSPTHA